LSFVRQTAFYGAIGRTRLDSTVDGILHVLFP